MKRDKPSLLPRRLLGLAAALLLAAGLGAAPRAQAQAAYPAKPVRVVVAFTAGGTTDILARAVTQQMSEKLGQPFVIDNKPGGGGNIGTEFVVRAPADGYTLIVNSVGPMAVNQRSTRTCPTTRCATWCPWCRSPTCPTCWW